MGGGGGGDGCLEVGAVAGGIGCRSWRTQGAWRWVGRGGVGGGGRWWEGRVPAGVRWGGVVCGWVVGGESMGRS